MPCLQFLPTANYAAYGNYGTPTPNDTLHAALFGSYKLYAAPSGSHKTISGVTSANVNSSQANALSETLQQLAQQAQEETTMQQTTGDFFVEN